MTITKIVLDTYQAELTEDELLIIHQALEAHLKFPPYDTRSPITEHDYYIGQRIAELIRVTLIPEA